jgi:hypothetical protein
MEIHREMNEHAGQPKQRDGLKEIRSWKRHNTKEAARTPKKAALQRASIGGGGNQELLCSTPDTEHGH